MIHNDYFSKIQFHSDRVGKTKYCASRNLRIKLHVPTYFCVIVNFLVKLCARNITLGALHALSHLILGTTLHGKNHPHLTDAETEVYRS